MRNIKNIVSGKTGIKKVAYINKALDFATDLEEEIKVMPWPFQIVKVGFYFN